MKNPVSMKWLSYLLLCIFLSCNADTKNSTALEDVKSGMTRSEVLKIAGEPVRKTNIGTTTDTKTDEKITLEHWLYDGEKNIVFENGKVVQVNLVGLKQSLLDSLKKRNN